MNSNDRRASPSEVNQIEKAIMEELVEDEELVRYKNPWAPNGRWRFVPEGSFGTKFNPSFELRGPGGGGWKQMDSLSKKEGWWIPAVDWSPPAVRSGVVPSL
jgi:hypothetical protein